MARKWVKVNNLSGGQYSVNKNISLKTPMWRWDLSDYNNGNVVVKGTTVEDNNANRQTNKILNFKRNAPFGSCISKINNIFIEKVEYFDTVVQMYDLLEYSDNYFMISGRFWNYHRDEINNMNKNNTSIR